MVGFLIHNFILPWYAAMFAHLVLEPGRLKAGMFCTCFFCGHLVAEDVLQMVFWHVCA